jgi:hypothetical protein
MSGKSPPRVDPVEKLVLFYIKKSALDNEWNDLAQKQNDLEQKQNDLEQKQNYLAQEQNELRAQKATLKKQIDIHQKPHIINYKNLKMF